MSNLLVQNIKHTNNTSAQTIDSSGRTTAVLNNDTTYRSDGGAVTQNMVQGLCKCWVNYTCVSTTAERDSFNVSSLTDITTGQTTVNINNNMANDDYSGYYYTNTDSNTAYTNFNNQLAGGFGSFETGLFKHNSYSTTDVDAFQNLCGIFGDLA